VIGLRADDDIDLAGATQPATAIMGRVPSSRLRRPMSE
jgi:hypothetical protein